MRLPPTVLAHDEKPHRRIFFHAVGLALEPVIKPPHRDAVGVHRGLGSEVHLPVLRAAHPVDPGAHHQLLVFSGQRLGRELPNELEVLDRLLTAAVEPTRDMEHGHAHFPVAFLVAPPPGRGRDRLAPLALGRAQEVLLPEPLPLVQEEGPPLHFATEDPGVLDAREMIPGQSKREAGSIALAIGLIHPTVGEQHPADVADRLAARVDGEVVKVGGVPPQRGRADEREQSLEIRVLLIGHEVLHHPHIGRTRHSNLATGPGPGPQPGDRVAPILGLVALAVPLPFGVVLAPAILDGEGKAVLHVVLAPLGKLGGLAPVRGPDEDHRVASGSCRPVDVGGQPHSVAHRHHDVLLDDDAAVWGLRQVHRYRLRFPGWSSLTDRRRGRRARRQDQRGYDQHCTRPHVSALSSSYARHSSPSQARRTSLGRERRFRLPLDSSGARRRESTL